VFQEVMHAEIAGGI